MRYKRVVVQHAACRKRLIKSNTVYALSCLIVFCSLLILWVILQFPSPLFFFHCCLPALVVWLTESDPSRNLFPPFVSFSGLPVFYGDVYRPEVLNAFNVGKAKAVICTLSDIKGTNKAVVNLRRAFPDLPVRVHAKLSSSVFFCCPRSPRQGKCTAFSCFA